MVSEWTKDHLVSELNRIRSLGWVPSVRAAGNNGAVGNTLENLLGIAENNLPVSNAGEWELKPQRRDTGSLTTLFHMEPSPRTFRFIPQLLLPKYGWPHRKAGQSYPDTERSFRQTLNATAPTDRGFKLYVNWSASRVEVTFNSNLVDERHVDWKQSVDQTVGLDDLSPRPYWGFDDLYHKVAAKLNQIVFVIAESRVEGPQEWFRYSTAYMLNGVSEEKFISVIEQGALYVDFDARTGHNHGTKFRLRQSVLPTIYENSKLIIDPRA